jgi:hypothetical protein
LRRRVLLAGAALALSACSGGEGVEVVQGFHGYAWGTRVSEIPEVAGSEPVGEKDGLRIYSADVSHLGREVLAGFYFHPGDGGLVEGYYVMPLALEECEQEWSRAVEDLESAYPALRREADVPVRSAEDSTRYVSDCEYFVYHGETEEWTETLVNPEPPGDRAGAWLSVEGRSLRLTVFYRGGAGQRWEDRFRWPRIFRRREAPEPGPDPGAPTRPRPGAEGLPVGRA